MKLYPYQRQGVNKMLNQSSIFLCDDMGLGKTVQVCTLIKERNKFPTLVVCPAHLKENWKRELKKWAGIDVNVDDINSKVIITNYERLTKSLHSLKRCNIQQIIFDECHILKTPTSQCFKAAMKLVDCVSYRVMITGTPVLNRPKELLCQLEVAGLTYKFGGKDKFLQDFCGTYQSPWGTSNDGHSNLSKLNKAMKKVWIRRLKNVQQNLPPKTVHIIPCCTISQPEPTSFEEIEKYDREVLKQKLPYCIDYIRKVLERGESVVVFVHHRSIVEKLRKEFIDTKYIIGGQTKQNRQQNIDNFQMYSEFNANHTNLIVCSLQASAVGITLTKAHTAIFIEYPWSPAIMCQAEDRIHRIGQTEPCDIVYLYAKDSIDEYKLRTQNIKKTIISHTMKEV